MMILKGTKEGGVKVILGRFNYVVMNQTCVCAVEYKTDGVVLFNISDYLQFSIEEEERTEK